MVGKNDYNWRHDGRINHEQNRSQCATLGNCGCCCLFLLLVGTGGYFFMPDTYDDAYKTGKHNYEKGLKKLGDEGGKEGSGSDGSSVEAGSSAEGDEVGSWDGACKTSNWSPWGDCSSVCGWGFQNRSREKLNNNCEGFRMRENRSCFMHCPPCEVGTWGGWSNCTFDLNDTCGWGYSSRFREINSSEFCNSTGLNYSLWELENCFINCTGDLNILNFTKNVGNNAAKAGDVWTDESGDELSNSSLSVRMVVGIVCSVVFLAGCVGVCVKHRRQKHITAKRIDDNALKAVGNRPQGAGTTYLVNPMHNVTNLQEKLDMATKLDREGKYIEAYKLYKESCEILKNLCYTEPGNALNVHYRHYIGVYTKRMTEIAKRFPEDIAKLKEVKAEESEKPGMSMVISADHAPVLLSTLRENAVLRHNSVCASSAKPRKKSREKIKHEFKEAVAC